MRTHSRLFLLFGALALSLFASVYALRSMKPPATAAVASLPNTAVLWVASGDLAAGTVLTAGHLRSVEWPLGQVPQGSFAEQSALIGRVLRSDSYAGEPLLEARLAPHGASGGITAAIPEGMRAVSVRVDEVIGVAGFVLPGSKVDVLATLGSSEADAITVTVLRDVELLAADQRTSPKSDTEPEKLRIATLLLTPSDAESLVHASARGRIHLTLRNPLDPSTPKTSGATSKSLLPERTSPPSVRRITPSVRVEAIHGTSRAVTQY